jgi:hypothetical protein
MNPNDARIANAFTTGLKGIVPDNTPIDGQGGGNQYDVVVQLEAGGTLGSGQAPYTVTLIAFSDDVGVAEPNLTPPVVNETFDGDRTGLDATRLWKKSNNDFFREIRQTITVPACTAGPVEAHHHRQPPGHRRGLETALVLQPPHVPLDISAAY